MLYMEPKVLFIEGLPYRAGRVQRDEVHVIIVADLKGTALPQKTPNTIDSSLTS